MDPRNRQLAKQLIELSLKLAKIRKKCGDLGTGVFVCSVKTDQRVQHEEARRVRSDGLFQADLVPCQVEAYPRCRDDVHVEIVDGHIPGVHERSETLAHGAKGVLSQVDEDGSTIRHVVATETRRGARHADGHLECNP